MKNIQMIINAAITKGCISPNLCTVPKRGANTLEIRQEEVVLPRKLTEQHKDFLTTWNGIRLDVINFYGCGEELEEGIDRISEWQFGRYGSNAKELFGGNFHDLIIIGDTPSGQMIIEDRNGYIYIFAFDGLPIEKVASDLEDFICNYVFGSRAAEFAGEEWLQELKQAGLV